MRFAIVSDEASNVRNLPYHAAMAASYGLPPEEALKAITIYPAQILGVDAEIGSLEEGKVADLVVTTGDILEIVNDVVTVFIAGKPVSLETRHTRLYDKFRQRLKKRSGGSKEYWMTGSLGKVGVDNENRISLDTKDLRMRLRDFGISSLPPHRAAV